MEKTAPIPLGGSHRFTLKECVAIARHHKTVALHLKARRAMERSLEILSRVVGERLPVYGVNTQFGSQVSLFDANLSDQDDQRYLKSLAERQLNLVRSHNCGLGSEVPEEVVRAAMALRAHCLGLGASGVRPAVAEALINFLNHGIHPVVLRYGSIGASGDLIPLAAIAAALIGEETTVYFQGTRLAASQALRRASLKPLQPEMREGLALINGTSFMTAIAALALADLKTLFGEMLKAVAMTLEALLVIDSAYEPFVHEMKGQRGEIEVSDTIRTFWAGSALIRKLEELRRETLKVFKENNKPNKKSHPMKHLQDYYSLRSVAQGFGPFKENLSTATAWIENEMNSVNDNPLIGARPARIYHGANFMGYYVTEACDLLKMDIAQASTWIHALLANLVHPRKNLGLSINLITKPNIDNGFRPLQILAASLAVQNRKFAQIQQAYMLPTEGDNQDVNSLGAHAAFDLKEAVENLERLTAILCLAAAQAVELRGVERAGTAARRFHSAIRTVSSFIDTDRSLAKDIEAVIALIREAKLP